MRHPAPTEGCLPNVRGEQVALRQRLQVKRLIHLQKCVGGTVSSLLEPRFDLQIEFCAGIVSVGEVGEVCECLQWRGDDGSAAGLPGSALNRVT